MSKQLLLFAFLLFALSSFAQQGQELKLGIQPFNIKSSITANYEWLLNEEVGLFVDLTYFDNQRSLFDIDNVISNETVLTYSFPSLSIRVGGNVYFGRKPNAKWGIGLSTLSEIVLMENEQYEEDIELLSGRINGSVTNAHHDIYPRASAALNCNGQKNTSKHQYDYLAI
ncbi:MAG: hypothetical protein AAGI23_15055 [Bacteroidota bacterium]